MNAAVFRALIYADSRLLWRDPLLGWIFAERQVCLGLCPR